RIGTISISGDLDSSERHYIYAGPIANLTVTRAVSHYQIVAGGIGTVSAGSWANTDVAAASLKALKVTGFSTADAPATTVPGDFKNSSFVVTGPYDPTRQGIASITVAGDMTQSSFEVKQGLGTLTVGGA